MVIKVGNINPILFRSVNTVTKPEKQVSEQKNITGEQNVTPDFAVTVPTKYTKISQDKLPNGLEVYSYKLANGYRVTVIPMEGSPAVVKNYVNVGSLNETDDIKGISHFLEHMAFNGTTGENGYMKLETGDSFKKIDALGGWINASTGYAVTDYVNSTPVLEENDLEEQIKIIAAMTEDLAITDKMIEKEKGPVCSEINMIMDNPITIALDQTVRSVFDLKSSADELVAGSVEHIKNLTRDDVRKYYDKYYIPQNMNLVVTGDVSPDEVIELVSKNFKSTKVRSGMPYEESLRPINSTVRKDFMSDKATQAEVVLGFAGPNNNDVKSDVITDLVADYLSSTSVGINKELQQLNSYPGFFKEKISTNRNNPSLLYYGFSIADENSEKVLRLVFDKLSNLKAPTAKELENLKFRYIKQYNEFFEYSDAVNTAIGNSILDGTFDKEFEREKILNSITPDDIQEYINKYLDLSKVAVTVVHPETKSEDVLKNYEKANNLSFKGKTRLPLNYANISETTLDNNYKMAFYKTPNNNCYAGISYKFNAPKNINPAALPILGIIYNQGSTNEDYTELEKFKEENNIYVEAELTSKYLDFILNSKSDNFDIAAKKTIEIMNNPRITEEEVNVAIKKLKDSYARKKTTSQSLFKDFEGKQNHSLYTDENILNGLDTVTVDDVVKLHNYIMNNSQAKITMNIPQSIPQIKENAIEIFSEMQTVKPYEYKVKNIYKPYNESVVLQKAMPVSQADIMQIYKFNFSDDIKEKAVSNVMNTILSSSSIGLFNVLREKEHLAYSVYSEIDKKENCGHLSCNILTTTDNKEINEISYDNVQKSIDGFHRQINCLLNSEFTDEDLESAKRKLKASLLDKQGISSKLNALNRGLESNVGLEYDNKLYAEIDGITREDVVNFAKKVFENPPVYSIVASQDTLDANKEYLDSLTK